MEVSGQLHSPAALLPEEHAVLLITRLFQKNCDNELSGGGG
jgi:hypothetical protein